MPNIFNYKQWGERIFEAAESIPRFSKNQALNKDLNKIAKLAQAGKLQPFYSQDTGVYYKPDQSKFDGDKGINIEPWIPRPEGYTSGTTTWKFANVSAQASIIIIPKYSSSSSIFFRSVNDLETDLMGVNKLRLDKFEEQKTQSVYSVSIIIARDMQQWQNIPVDVIKAMSQYWKGRIKMGDWVIGDNKVKRDFYDTVQKSAAKEHIEAAAAGFSATA